MARTAQSNATDILFEGLREAARRRGITPFAHGPGVAERAGRLVVEPRIWLQVEYAFCTRSSAPVSRLEIAPKAASAIATLNRRRTAIEAELGAALDWSPSAAGTRLTVALPVARRHITDAGERELLIRDLVDAMARLQAAIQPHLVDIDERLSLQRLRSQRIDTGLRHQRGGRTRQATAEPTEVHAPRSAEVDPHPILSLYGRTAQADFPLIMVVGREPNTDRPVEPTVGVYDLAAAPRCTFWNAAYCLAARAITGDEHASGVPAKRLCVDVNLSPIVVADSLPIGIQYGALDMQRRRSGVPEDAIREHARRIFSFSAITRRIRLVLLCGLDEGPFRLARCVLEAECKRAGIPYRAVPFLSTVNMPKLVAAVDLEAAAIIRSVWATFLAARAR